jgi:hypothetical protein
VRAVLLVLRKPLGELPDVFHGQILPLVPVDTAGDVGQRPLSRRISPPAPPSAWSGLLLPLGWGNAG